MKPSSNLFFRPLVSLAQAWRVTVTATALLAGTAWSANDLYWDSDGTTTGGSGGSTAVGTWGTSVFWNPASNGGGPGPLTDTTSNINDLHFSASTDVSGTYTVTVNGTQSANLLIFEEGTVTLSGGTSITLGGGGGVDTGVRFVSGTGANTISTAIVLGADAVFTNADNSTQTISGGITGAFDIIIKADSSGLFTFGTGSLNNAGTITNSGTGSAPTAGTTQTTISGIIGSSVESVIQDSQTSVLRLTGDNATFAGGVYIKSGTVIGATSANAFGTAAIRLGDDSVAGPGNTASATLQLGLAGTYSNDIVLGNTSGALTITTANTGSGQGFNGGITGNNNLRLSNTGTQTFTLSSSNSEEINHTGTLTNISTGTGAVSISEKIGSNVTGVIQDAGMNAGALTLSNTGNTFVNGITIRRGRLSIGATGATGAAANTITLGDTAGAVGSFNDATLQLSAGGVHITNAINLAANAAGTLTIASTTTSGTANSVNSDITLNGKQLIFAHNAASTTGVMNVHNTAGSFIGAGSLVNAGTGTGIINLAGAIGNNVTSVTQNSATSGLRLSNNNAFGVLNINAGYVEGRQAAGITTSLGGGIVNLGGSGTDAAALYGQGVNATFGNAIVLGTTSGPLTIGALAATAPVTFTGGITGTNDINFSSGSSITGASPVTFSGGSINNTGKVTNSTVTGTSEIFVSSLIGSNVTEVVQNSATAGMTLQGAQTYSAATTVSAGVLTLADGASLGGTSVSVTGGTFRIAGNSTIGTSGSPVLNIGENGLLSLQNGGINTLMLNSATAGATALNFTAAGTSIYQVDLLGSSADTTTLGTGLLASVGASPVTVRANALGQLTTGSRTILSASGGGLNSGGGFVLDTSTGNFGGSQLSLTNLGTSLQLNVTAASAAPSVLYFTGALDNNFSTFTGGNTNNSNFSTDAAGTIDAFAAPDSGTEVHIQATSLASATRNITLGRDFEIKSLFIDAQVANPLTISSGVGTSSLTLAPTSSTEGITVNSSAGGTVTISAPLVLGTNQTFTNNSANLLTVSGAISGNSSLVFNGNVAGGMTFSGAGANTYNGLTTVTAGTLNLAKTAGVTAIAGNILVNGGNLAFTNDDQIDDDATVTVTSGSFNTTTGAPNVGLGGLDEKFAGLSVSGSGHFYNGNNGSVTGVEITGNASFTGDSVDPANGASFFGGSGTAFSAGSLTLTDMSRTSTTATGAPTLAQIANGFIVYGNNSEQSRIQVGTGGLLMQGTNSVNHLVLRAGTGGSKVTLDGDVTTNGTFASGIVFDATGGTTGSVSVDLSGSITTPLNRTFNVGGGGANLNMGVAMTNGASSSAGIIKTGAGTMTLSATSTYTGTTAIQQGVLQVGAGGSGGNLSASTAIEISSSAIFRTSRSGTLNLTQAISGDGNVEISNTTAGITNFTGVDKTYTGSTTVTNGTLGVVAGINSSTSIEIRNTGRLELGASQRILDSAAITLVNGGTLDTNGFSETAGTLGLSGGNSIIDLANGASILSLANSSGVTWTGGLSILNWSGTALTGGGTDQIIFGSDSSGLLSGQLASILFVNPFGDGMDYDAQWASGLNGEIVPGMIIPEPSGILLSIAGGLGLLLRRRRKHP